MRRVGEAVAAGTTYPFTYRSDLSKLAGDTRRPLTFSRSDADAIEAELYSHLVPIRRRIWLQRALLLMVRGLVLVAAIYLLAAFFQFAAIRIPQPIWSAAAIVVSVVALALILRQRVSYADAARVLDRRLGLNQVIGTAVELTGNNADGRLARLQTRRATDVLRRLESREAVPFGLPLRDLRAFAVLAVATLLFTFLATLNLAWPGSPPPSEELAIDPAADMVTAPPDEYSSYVESEGASTLDPELFNHSLDDYRMEMEGQNLSPEEIQARIAEIQAQLAQRAEALQRQRQAMTDLADALSDSSTTSDAADSIRKGDYAKAATQLSELGKQSKQLSARARQDLAKRLNDASNKVQPNNADLANKMKKAAQQLASSDASGAEQALNELGEGVQQTGDQIGQLSDASQPYDPNSDPSSIADPEGAGSPSSDISSEDLGALQNYEGAGMDMDSMGASTFDDYPSDQAAPGSGLANPGSLGGEQASQDASKGGGAGGGPGSEQYRSSDLARSSQGKVLELRGRPSDSGGSSQLDDGGKVPLVSTNDGSVSGAQSGTARTAIVDPLSVRGEQNFVPWEKRQIVKDYFTGPAK
jgi:hypothetical protein